MLNVTMRGDTSESRMFALPFDVYGPSGEALGRGVVSPTEPVQIRLSRDADDLPRVYVVAVRPDGEQLQASARLQGGPDDATHVTLEAGTKSPHEWLSWVTPFRSLDHLNTSAANSSAYDQRRRVGSVWVTLWRLQDGQWRATDANPIMQRMSDGARLIVLDVRLQPHLLQIGGDDVAWRLVSLPPGGPARIALTRRAAESGDTIDVTVGRLNPVNDLIMSYLTHGEAAQAASLAEAWQAADIALYEKLQDPVSAAAGAYVLLKMNRMESRWDWVENLVNWFEYLADGPIVAAALELQRPEADLKRVRALVTRAMKRGLPVFSMGLSVLVETMAAIHRGKRESKGFQMYYQAARAFLQARASKGAYLAFYGRSPAEPSSTRLYGGPSEPRVEDAAHRLGSGIPSEWPLPLSSVAPKLERLLIGESVPRSTDELMRLGLMRQYGMPIEEGLQVQVRVMIRDTQPPQLTNPFQIFPNDLNAQRSLNAMQIFDSDE
jgi:hypothetical protein